MSSPSGKEPEYTTLAEMAGYLLEATQILSQILAATDRVELKSLRKSLGKLSITNTRRSQELLRQVASSFVTPIDRDDLTELVVGLRRCMARIAEAGDFMVMYQLPSIPSGMTELADILQKCAELSVEAANSLHRMEDLEEYWLAINRLENEGDQIYRKQLVALFEMDLEFNELVKLKDVLRVLEGCIDAFEDFADAIESMAMKSS